MKTTARVLALIGGSIAALSALMPYINTALVDGDYKNLRYLELWQGKLALVAGLAIVIAAVATFVRPALTSQLAVAIAGLGAVALLVAILGIVELGSSIDEFQRVAEKAAVPAPSRAGGPYAHLVGSVLALVAGLLLWRSSDPARMDVATTATSP